MAPRGRSRKKGQTRMDAALDAMRAFGFPQNLIVKTLKDLLKVYGEDGWPFIEEASYKVLLDTILEKVEKEEQQKKDNSSQDEEIGGNDTKRSAAGPSTMALVPTFSHVEDMDIELPTNEALDSSSQTNEALGTALPINESTNEYDGKSRLPPVDGHRPRTRRPCHGWICSDDEEDLIELTPGPLSEELAEFLFGTDPRRRKRKSRWDVRPEDL